MVKIFYKVHPDYGTRLANKLGLENVDELFKEIKGEQNNNARFGSLKNNTLQ